MKFDTGWADAVAKIGLAVVATCSLVTMLVTRCDQQKTNKALGKQLGEKYFQELKEGVK